MDKLKIKLTIGAAEKQLELLAQSIEQGNQPAIADALHNTKRELYTLRQLIEPKPKLERSAEPALKGWNTPELKGWQTNDADLIAEQDNGLLEAFQKESDSDLT